MAMTFAALLRAAACPLVLRPQPTTVPSARRARLWLAPAAIAMTLVALGGTLVCPEVLLPQAMTVPSSRNANWCDAPAATATRLPFVSAGGSGGLVLPVQFTTVPSARRTRLLAVVVAPPMEMATRSTALVGGPGSREG